MEMASRLFTATFGEVLVEPQTPEAEVWVATEGDSCGVHVLPIEERCRSDLPVLGCAYSPPLCITDPGRLFFWSLENAEIRDHVVDGWGRPWAPSGIAGLHIWRHRGTLHSAVFFPWHCQQTTLAPRNVFGDCETTTPSPLQTRHRISPVPRQTAQFLFGIPHLQKRYA